MCARPFEGDEPEVVVRSNMLLMIGRGFEPGGKGARGDLWVVFQHASSERATRAKGRSIDMKIMTIAAWFWLTSEFIVFRTHSFICERSQRS
jgi:hypothetical protein